MVHTGAFVVLLHLSNLQIRGRHLMLSSIHYSSKTAIRLVGIRVDQTMHVFRL